MLEKSGKILHEHFLAIKGETTCMSILKVHCNQNGFTRLEFLNFKIFYQKMFKNIKKDRNIKAQAEFEIMAYRVVVYVLTHCLRC